MKATGLLAAAALVGSAVLLAAVVLLGPPGLVVGCVVLAGVGLIVVRLRLGLPERAPAAPADRTDPLQPYPTYRQLNFAIDSGLRSARLFDRALAPRLTRLAAAALAERRGIDLHRDPDAAREALGDDVWTVVAPGSASATQDADRGGRARDVALVLDRLEEL